MHFLMDGRSYLFKFVIQVIISLKSSSSSSPRSYFPSSPTCFTSFQIEYIGQSSLIPKYGSTIAIGQNISLLSIGPRHLGCYWEWRKFIRYKVCKTNVAICILSTMRPLSAISFRLLEWQSKTKRQLIASWEIGPY